MRSVNVARDRDMMRLFAGKNKSFGPAAWLMRSGMLFKFSNNSLLDFPRSH